MMAESSDEANPETTTAFPDEVVELILSYCSMSSMASVRLVCRKWNEIVKSGNFWKIIMDRHERQREYNIIRNSVNRDHSDAWQVYLFELKCRFLSSNLMKNPSGADGFNQWNVLSGDAVPQGWVVLRSPLHPQDPLFHPSSPTLFLTGGNSCSKEQVVDFWENGFNPAVIRACVPFDIVCSEWVSGGSENGVYELRVNFLDREHHIMSPFSPYERNIRKLIGANHEWQEIRVKFSVSWVNAYEVIDDLRYFQFYHGGMASRPGAPNQSGPKMCGTQLRINIVQHS